MVDKFNLNHFSSFTVNGKQRDIEELEDYLNYLDRNDIKVNQKLNIGDIVKLKGREYAVVVEYIDYEIEGMGKVDYAGRRIDGVDANMISIFNQNEVDAILEKNEEIINGRSRK